MAKQPRTNQGRPAKKSGTKQDDAAGPGFVRIIAGDFRRRQLPYLGDRRTRPMKDRVRENVFNLMQQVVEGTHALDLFAGTGALGFEALSRKAAAATFCEQHSATAEQIRKNAEFLGAAERAHVVTGDTFRHFATFANNAHPWLVFCSPPYEFYVSRAEAMQELIQGLYERAPSGSWFVVECDQRFDPETWTWAEWDVRHYPPAVVAVAGK